MVRVAVAVVVVARRRGAAVLVFIEAEPPDHLVDRHALDAGGARGVTASDDQTARVWDAATGESVAAPLQHQGRVVSAAFSPDGARVVTASWDHTARVWDAVSGKPLAAPLVHQAPVHDAAFSPDGTRVVTASDDHTARVWETRLDETPRDGWSALAARSPFVLVSGVLQRRVPHAP